MKSIAIEGIMADTIVSFSENAAELGCPHSKEVDMWFRDLPDEEKYDVMSKLLDIQERNEKTNQECEEKDVLMKEITLDLDEDIIEKILEFARSKIVNDKQALINYGVNFILKEIVDSDGSCLETI